MKYYPLPVSEKSMARASEVALKIIGRLKLVLLCYNANDV